MEGFFLEEDDLVKGIETYGDQDFLANLKNVDSELATEGFFTEDKKESAPVAKVVQMGKRRRFLSIAAAVGIVVIALWGMWQFTQPKSTFADNFTVYEDEISSFLGETGFVRPDYVDSLTVGMQAYNQKNYKEAISNFSYYLSNSPQDDQFYSYAQFYQAQAYLATSQIRSANTILTQLSALDNFKLINEVRWYLGLSYWALGQKAEAQRTWQLLKGEAAYEKRLQRFE